MHKFFTPKKILIVFFVIGAIFLCAPAFSQDLYDANDIEPGDIIKLENDSAIYYITEEKERKFFPVSWIYSTYFSDFNDVKTLRAGTDLDIYFPPASKSALMPRAGSKSLFKSPISSRVYVMGLNNVRYHIKDEATASRLFGNDWNNYVSTHDLPDFVSSNGSTLGGQIDGPFPGFISRRKVAVAGGAILEYYRMNTSYEWEKIEGNLPGIVQKEVNKLPYFSDANFNEFVIAQTTVDAVSIDKIDGVSVSVPTDTVDNSDNSETINNNITENVEVIEDPVVVENDSEINNSNPSGKGVLSAFEMETLQEINSYRKQSGLGTLVHDDELYEIAKGHSQYMYDTNIFDHVGFEERFEAADRMYCAENLAWNYASAYDMVWEGWKNSPGHNENLLRTQITSVGISKVGAYVTYFACQ